MSLLAVSMHYEYTPLIMMQFTVGGVFNSLKTVQNPVYLIGGLSDQLVPVDNVRKMASQLPISWLSIFPGKHGALLQNQDMFLSVYDEFLNVWRM